jgi:UDP-N-acetyl-D-mannosaminuronic acid transferase (WecB/TagA/CpsF family)
VSYSQPTPRLPTKRVLGIDFFDGTPTECVEYVSKHGGLVVAPGAPSMVALQYDGDYRRAIGDADLAIADSGWMVLFWRLLRREQVTRISGLSFSKALLASAAVRIPGNLFWILPSERAKTKALEFARASVIPITSEDCYVAPDYSKLSRGCMSQVEGECAGGASHRDAATRRGYSVIDPELVAMIEGKKPKHVIIGIGGGTQDKLGSYLKDHLSYRPGIYCIGAAPGFVTGDQVEIPAWADRLFVGWIFRLFAQPRVFIPRLWKAHKLPYLILRYGSGMPPLKN